MIKKPKIRRSWAINPKTRVKKNKKKDKTPDWDVAVFTDAKSLMSDSSWDLYQLD